MLVVYHCCGYSHTAAIAAAIHLGKLDFTRIPTGRVIDGLDIPLQETSLEKGKIYPLGIDEQGWQVSILYRGRNPAVLVRALGGVIRVLNKDPNEFVFVDTDLCAQNERQTKRYLLACFIRCGWKKRNCSFLKINGGYDYYRLAELVNECKRQLKTHGKRAKQ
ncbi:MAG: DUF3189 family protein [bacterium]|jgi:hypothetical protein